MENKTNTVFNEIRRNVAGIDLAWRADHYVCGPRRDDGGHDIASFGTTTPELYRLLKWCQDRHVESVAVESTSVYWIPLADLFESNGIEVVLVDPREVQMVPCRKSDVKDCQWLQKLHSSGLLRGAFRPPEQVAAIRSILREKENLIAMRTQSIQQMQKGLDQMNIRVHHAVSDIDGKTGTAIVKAIVEGERDPLKLAALRDKRCKKSVKEIADHLTGTWREEHLFNLGQAFKTLQFLNERIAEYDMKVKEMFALLSNATDSSDDQPPSESLSEKKQTTKSREDAIAKAVLSQYMKTDLTLIPGIGHDSATIIISELGNNFDRFPTEKHFVSYIGLAPPLSKSAGKNVRHKKCKNSSRVGQRIRMCAFTLRKSDCELGAIFRNVAKRSDMKTAIKATARKIAVLIYRAVKHGMEYIDRGAKAFENRSREKALNLVNKLIKSHNINVLEINGVV